MKQHNSMELLGYPKFKIQGKSAPQDPGRPQTIFFIELLIEPWILQCLGKNCFPVCWLVVWKNGTALWADIRCFWKGSPRNGLEYLDYSTQSRHANPQSKSTPPHPTPPHHNSTLTAFAEPRWAFPIAGRPTPITPSSFCHISHKFLHSPFFRHFQLVDGMFCEFMALTS